MKALALILAFATSASSAQTAFISGNKMVDLLTGNGAEQGMALGYIAGVVDLLDTAGQVCLPGGVTTGQLRDLVRKEIASSPEIRHNDAHMIVSAVMMTHFPCKKGTRL